MGLADQWREIEAQLLPRWGEARVGLRLEQAAEADEVSALLAPLQPLRTDERAVSIRITSDGSGPSVEALRRGLARLEARRLRGTLSLLSSEQAPSPGVAAEPPSLAGSWRAELATVPADWSDLLGEIELDSSDYLDRAAVNLAPLNPRRSGEMTALRFRSARRFGYGASPGVVHACLERCDRDGIRGHVRVLRVLCDTRPVGTQGPVWQIDGEMT
jgi:hypothetical protein